MRLSCLFVWAICCSFLWLCQPTDAGYLQEDEELFGMNWDSHMQANFAEGAEAPILEACRRKAPFWDESAITVQPSVMTSTLFATASTGSTTSTSTTTSASTSDPAPAIMTSSDVQQQCHESYLCIIPAHVTVLMTSSLLVGALEVRGALEWTDDTQGPDEAYLCAGYVVASQGGSISVKVTTTHKKAWIYLMANGAKHERLGWRVLGGWKARKLELVGRPLHRTWTLLDQPLYETSTTLKLLHDPIAMGWKVGDRIGIAPTQPKSLGIGQTFVLTHVASDGTVLLDHPSEFDHAAQFLPSRTLVTAHDPEQDLKSQGSTTTSKATSKALSTSPSSQQDHMPPILKAAEVVNLSRNLIITGDDFEEIPCDPELKNPAHGCMCTKVRSTCTVGLHTVLSKTGQAHMAHTRVERCGQRGILGKYCLHLHKRKDCPDCHFNGNAIESSMQRGIVLHGTHRALVERNVLWNVRGSNVYIEDGNELYNVLRYNVAICPHPLDDPIQHGCTLPGTSNGSADTRQNQAGFYLKSSTNDLIGNRAANSRNGMFAEAGVDGDAKGKVCHQQTVLGRWEGNTFHGHARFGTYPIKFYPQQTDRSLETDGMNLDMRQCIPFDAQGNTKGISSAIVNHVDYDNVFVGQYEVGDIQYQGHASLNNKNLIYWKETKNFEDGCSAHISQSYYAHGNLALPDQATVIIEDTVLDNVSLEANHHCQVGATGFLCMPQYILHNVQWQNGNPHAPWMYFQQGKTDFGGIFSLSPESNPNTSPFPPGYKSLVSERYDYLLEAPNGLCVSSYNLELGFRYDNGILCQSPLRALKIYSRGLRDDGSAPLLKLEVWYDSKGVASHPLVRPSAVSLIPFHQIGVAGQTNKQGYAFPVLPRPDVSYRLSLTGTSKNIPEDWVVEFSDPIVGNRWGEEYVQLELRGRPCDNAGTVSSHHDRRFIYSGLKFLVEPAWGNHGACVVGAPPVQLEKCSARPALEASSCPELCTDGCSKGAYCDCRTATCQCKAGFLGDNCSIDVCSDLCGSDVLCASKYLGDTSLPIHSIDHACIDKPSGPPTRQLRDHYDDDFFSASTSDVLSPMLLGLVSLGWCLFWTFG